MKSLQETFLAEFETRFRSPLVEFAKRISSSDADILVFMARKAACLFHCFEDVRLAQTNKPCTSDLALEGDLSWVEGRSVELIDDTLITGTTLYRASTKLIAAGARSVSTTVFCVDLHNWSRELVTPDAPYLMLEPHDVTSFSAQAVRALGVIPRPYSIDYPLFGSIRLTGTALDDVLSRTGWRLDDVTTVAQAAAGVTSITMLPPSSVLREFDHMLGWHLSDASQLCKIRLYTRQRKGSRPLHSARVLPIVALDPLTHEQVEVLWNTLQENISSYLVPAGLHLRTPSERLRLIQFFLASRLFSLWLRDVRMASGRPRINAHLDHRQIDLAFPPLVRQHVVNAIAADVWQPLGGTPRFIVLPQPKRPTATGGTRFIGNDLPGVQAKLTEPLLELYVNRELPARELVREKGRSVFAEPEYRHLVDRLSQGVSLPEFRATLTDLKSDEAIRSLVSTFMDEAVDRGIAVPITVDDGITVPEEMHAVISLLKEHGSSRKERIDGAIFYTGQIPADGGMSHSVAATQQLKQGNRSVIAAYDRLMANFRPSIVVLLGIGGSIHEDAFVGDVVIADNVIWYEQSTVDEHGMRLKGEAAELSADLRVLVNDFFANRGYPYELPVSSPRGERNARLLLGPIGTGEKVVRYRDAEIRKLLHSFNYKTLALETEAGGLAQAFYESGLTLAHKARGYIVIRGISDHADAEKDDRWRVEACRNACVVLKDFFEALPPLSVLFHDRVS